MTADFSLLKSLREKTGVSFSLCKKALEESGNNMTQAIALLKKWGEVKANEKASRVTSQGALFSYVHHNRKIASMVELLCETDFVSSNSEFQMLGKEIAMQMASVPAESLDELLKQEYIRDPSKTIEGLIKESVLKFGEHIKLSRCVRWALGSE